MPGQALRASHAIKLDFRPPVPFTLICTPGRSADGDCGELLHDDPIHLDLRIGTSGALVSTLAGQKGAC